MKTLINFKADPEDAEKWREACRIKGVTISEVCRKALARTASRVEKEQAAE